MLISRTRNSAGQFSAKNALSALALRKVWGAFSTRGLPVPAATPLAPAVGLSAALRVVDFGAVSSEVDAGQIDEVNAVIRGVSVITSGLIARGHDLEVDNITLQQMLSKAQEKGQVPVKVDHKSGAAAVCGFLTNFRIEGAKLKADWHLLESHPQKAQILEVARRMPRGVGLSASFVSPEQPEKTSSGRTAARCDELISVDYVTLPAANPDGLLSAVVDTPETNTMKLDPETLAAIKAAVAEATAPLASQMTAMQEAMQAGQPTDEQLPSLEEFSQMTPEQLAQWGLTPADVEGALEAAAQAEDAAEGAAEDAAAPAAPAGAGVGLDALVQQITELSEEVASLRQQEQATQEETLLSSIEGKVELLARENLRLQHALSAGSIQPAKPTTTPAVSAASGNKHAFEQRVDALVTERKVSRGKATELAAQENPGLHVEYMQAQGLLKKA